MPTPNPRTRYLVVLAIGLLALGYAFARLGIAGSVGGWMMLAAGVVFPLAVLADALAIGLSELEWGPTRWLWAISSALVPLLSILYFWRRHEARQRHTPDKS